MTTGLYVFIVSSFLLLVFVVLLNIEERSRQRVFLTTVRNKLDRGVVYLQKLSHHFSIHLGTGTFRLLLHFFVYKFLSIILFALRNFEKGLALVQQRNRKVAKIIKEEQAITHLEMLAEHQEQTALTEEEKQHLKDRSIEV